jgi:hypothetical protein
VIKNYASQLRDYFCSAYRRPCNRAAPPNSLLAARDNIAVQRIEYGRLMSRLEAQSVVVFLDHIDGDKKNARTAP